MYMPDHGGAAVQCAAKAHRTGLRARVHLVRGQALQAFDVSKFIKKIEELGTDRLGRLRLVDALDHVLGGTGGGLLAIVG